MTATGGIATGSNSSNTLLNTIKKVRGTIKNLVKTLQVTILRIINSKGKLFKYTRNYMKHE